MRFTINANKGFQIKLANGYRVSAQFGPGSESDHRNNFAAEPMNSIRWDSGTVEVAVFRGRDPVLPPFPWWGAGNTCGYVTTERYLELLNWAAEQE